MKFNSNFRLCLLVLLPLLSVSLSAQWQQQSIQLRPGWNAVFLEVRPEPEDCDTLFAGLPVESVWDFDRVVDLPQFVQDPSALVPGSPGWLTWYPTNHPLAGQGSLFILRDSRPYLIKMASNATAVTWTVTGRPSLRRTSWYAGGVNLAGFHVAATGPSFSSLFAGESGLAGQPVYSLDAAGAWRRLTDPANSRPQSGESYWVRCVAPARRAGTIEVNSGSREGLVFRNGGAELALRIRNSSATPRNITLRLLPSASPPAGQVPLAGPVPLEFWQSDFAHTNYGWTPLNSFLSFNALLPGQEWQIRFGARFGATASSGAVYQSLLEVADDAGTRWMVPVRAIQPGAETAGTGLTLAAAAATSHAGLWVGEAVLKLVSQPAHPADATTPQPAAGEFSFRLIVHVDETGAARLLHHAYLVRKPPVLAPDPENPGANRIEEAARTLVLTDEGFIPGLLGNGEITGRRVSTTAFAFKDPVPLSGEAFGTGALTGVVSLDYNDPLNPFKHQFHPDHNNLDERFERTLPEGRESFTVIRTLGFEFSATDPFGLNPPGWGETELGGIYRETFTGLHRRPIQVSGTFRLVRAARSPELNR